MNGRVAELQSDRAEAAEERRPDSHDPHPDNTTEKAHFCRGPLTCAISGGGRRERGRQGT